MREGVAVWPTKNQRIMGRLSLIKQHQVMFLAWLPYSPGSLNSDGTFYSSATVEKSATQSAKGIEALCTGMHIAQALHAAICELPHPIHSSMQTTHGHANVFTTRCFHGLSDH